MAVATKVSAGTMTSSSGSTPFSRRATCNAAVPFTTATAAFVPQSSASLCSKVATNKPDDETQPSSMQRLTYSHSLPAKCGL